MTGAELRVSAEEYPFAGRRMDLGGLSMHYVDEGRGDAVLMLHGNPTWSFHYRELVKALRGGWRTVVPDHIGCGLSDKPPERDYPYTLARRVADLGALVDGLGLERVHLVVHDWGGMIGMAWAVDHPDRVGRIVVLNTAAFPLPAGGRLPAALRIARTPGLGAALVRGASAFSRGANRLCATRRPLRPEVAAAYLAPYRSWAERVAVHAFVRDIPLSAEDPAWSLVVRTADRLELLRDHPVRIFWGLRDFVFDRRYLAEWRRRFPEAEVTAWEDAGHYVLEDAGDEIAPAVAAFLGAERPS